MGRSCMIHWRVQELPGIKNFLLQYQPRDFCGLGFCDVNSHRYLRNCFSISCFVRIINNFSGKSLSSQKSDLSRMKFVGILVTQDLLLLLFVNVH